MRALQVTVPLIVAVAASVIAEQADRIDPSEMIRLAQEQVQLGRLETARMMLVPNLSFLREEGGHTSLEATTLNILGGIANEQGRFREAELFYRRAISLSESLGPEARDGLSGLLNNLAASYFQQGRYADAERLYVGSLILLTDLKGPNHSDLGSGLNGLCSTERAMRHYSDAEAHCRRAVAVLQDAGDPFRPKLSESFLNLALLYVDQDELVIASEWSERALKFADEMTGVPPSALIQILLATADIRLKLGLPDDAAQTLRRAESTIRQYLTEAHPLMAVVLVLQARVLREQNAGKEALLLETRALQIITTYQREELTGSSVAVSDLRRFSGNSKQIRKLGGER